MLRTPPEPRKRPKQARSTLLVRSIKQACLQILEDEGPEVLTTQRIADLAGVDIASIYQYYPNKEAIIADVFGDQIEEYTEYARQRIPEIDRLSRASLEDGLARILEMEIEQHLFLYRLSPDFYRCYQASFDIHERVNELSKSMSNPSWEEWLPQFLSLHRERLRSQDVALLAKTVSLTLSGILVSVLKEEPDLLTQEAFRQELLILLLRYVCE